MFRNGIQPPHPLLEKQPNFRDIGGIPTSDGRFVKTGLLFRSGDLFRLSETDVGIMEEIGIRMIIDFRSDREVVKFPNPPIGTVQEKKRIVIIDSAREIAERMMEEEDAEGMGTILVTDYRRLARDHVADFREFFHVLAATDRLPLVYHCAAGKDRTGLATYLLLLALGVSEKDARNDYLLSNTMLKTVVEKVILKINGSGRKGEIIRPLMEVREEYLDSALEEIRQRFGNMDEFLEHLAGEDLLQLKRKYTALRN